MDAVPAIPTDLARRAMAVLIVETDFLVRWRTAEHLRARQYTVIEARDAIDAIGLLASGIRVDVVVSDASLTDELNKIGLTDWFERNHPHVPLLVTGADPAESLKRAANEKRRCIAKPYEVADIHSHIEALLGRS